MVQFILQFYQLILQLGIFINQFLLRIRILSVLNLQFLKSLFIKLNLVLQIKNFRFLLNL
jgi:hypothetical protein